MRDRAKLWAVPLDSLAELRVAGHLFSIVKWCTKQAGEKRNKIWCSLEICIHKTPAPVSPVFLQVVWSVNVHRWLTASRVLWGFVFSGACIRSLNVSILQMCMLAIKNAHYWNNLHLLQVLKVCISSVLVCFKFLHSGCSCWEHFYQWWNVTKYILLYWTFEVFYLILYLSISLRTLYLHFTTI